MGALFLHLAFQGKVHTPAPVSYDISRSKRVTKWSSRVL